MDTQQAVSVLASVDWITCTYKSTNRRAQVKTMLDGLIESEVLAGNRISNGSFNGYKTYSSGEALFGERDDGYIVRLTSLLAAKHWRSFVALASNVTRLDIAVTVKMSSDPKGMIEAAYQQATVGLGEEQQRRFALVQNSQGGATLYVGSRTSAQYARFYNKYAESKRASQWLNCIRYEVEFKKPLSLQVAMELQRQSDEGAWIGSYVRGWFLTRGVVPVYNSSVTVRALQIRRKESDNARTLNWLGRTVHGAYEQLRLKGLGEAAIDAIKTGYAQDDDNENN